MVNFNYMNTKETATKPTPTF